MNKFAINLKVFDDGETDDHNDDEKEKDKEHDQCLLFTYKHKSLKTRSFMDISVISSQLIGQRS